MNERIKRLFEIKKESQLPETLFYSVTLSTTMKGCN